MPHFFIFLLKINLVLVLFAITYYLILRQLTFYTINRVFLAFGILFSTVYPFINLTDFFHNQKQVAVFVPKLNQQVTALVPSNFITEHWQLISILFYVGVTLMALRLMVQFISLYQMHKKSAPGSISNYPVRILNEAVSPFSFWQTVYINPSLHKEQELQTILAHEKIHVKEWHSLDIILAELSVVFYWFNPGIWLMKKAVKENLEFITDQKILNNGIDKKTYQYSLLDVGTLIPAVAIVNNFNLSDLKKRIKMMNAKRSSRLTLSRYLLVTPILLLSTLAFTVAKKDIKNHLSPLRQVLINTHVIDNPKSEFKETAKKTVAKRKKAYAIEVKAKADSVNKFTYIIHSVFISRDSVINMPADLPKVSNFTRAEVAHGTITGTGTLKNIDSVSKGGKVQNVKIEFKSAMPPILTTNNQTKKEMIIVSNYGQVTKPLDSIKTNRTVSFFLNGKKLTQEEFNNDVKADEIYSVNVHKMGDKVGEIRIITKKKP